MFKRRGTSLPHTSHTLNSRRLLIGTNYQDDGLIEDDDDKKEENFMD